MIIWVINDFDKVCKIVANSMKDELPMDNVYSMVFIAALRGHKLTLLNIVDHGNSSSLNFGKETIAAGNFHTFRWTLKQLRPKFAASGRVRFHHCLIGNNTALLKKFAEVWGVPVDAGTGLTAVPSLKNGGVTVRCYAKPSAPCTTVP